MTDQIISLEHVDFWYDKGTPSEYHALRDISLTINRGEYIAFFGPSGSGKTTLLYLISGIEQGQQGRIVVNNRDIGKLSKRELAIYRQVGVGMIFQQFNLLPSLTVAQNVMLPMSFFGVSEDRAKAEAITLLDRVGIKNLADRYPAELSGGQQQRVGIVRALANNPPIIIADEPLGNLDSESAQAVLKFLEELNKKDGRTVIMVTHEAWSLRNVQRIFYMKDGAITKEEVTNPKTIGETLSKQLYGSLLPELSKSELTARALSHLMLRGYSAAEMKRFEFFLGQRLDGKIDTDVFREVLDRSWKTGGLGLWRQKAEKISAWVEEVIKEQRTVEEIYKELETNPQSPIKEDIRRVETWLLEDYHGRASDFQDRRLGELIADRIKGAISPENFLKTLSSPRSASGLGFAMHTAERMGEKLELAISRGHPEALSAAAA